jgi:hypothetical protein
MFCRKTCLPPSSSLVIKDSTDCSRPRFAERKRRGRKPADSVETPDTPRIEAAVVHLTPGKPSAVRAAFKAGVKPSQIKNVTVGASASLSLVESSTYRATCI